MSQATRDFDYWIRNALCYWFGHKWRHSLAPVDTVTHYRVPCRNRWLAKCVRCGEHDYVHGPNEKPWFDR